MAKGIEKVVLIIRVSHHIGRVHIVKHDLIGTEQHSHGSGKWVSERVRIDPFERTVWKASLYEHGVVHGLSLFT